ncbi:MAG: hypothetical protein PQJ59_12015 [Spirochaetales bacterium]|nr:hypothetical protein [Spirochaetales bacterium]
MSTLSDDKIRRLVVRWRRRLGYDEPDLGEIEKVEWEPPAWLVESLEKISNFFIGIFEWVFQEGGWKILLPFAVFLFLFLIFLGARNIRSKRKALLIGEEEEEFREEGEEILVEGKTGNSWLSLMERAKAREDYNSATVALYRSVLAEILEKIVPVKELSNREISYLVTGRERSFFCELYRLSDSVVFGENLVSQSDFDRLLGQYREVAL